MTMMMAMMILPINWLEGDILPDSSPWSFVSSELQLEKEMLES